MTSEVIANQSKSSPRRSHKAKTRSQFYAKVIKGIKQFMEDLQHAPIWIRK